MFHSKKYITKIIGRRKKYKAKESDDIIDKKRIEIRMISRYYL